MSSHRVVISTEEVASVDLSVPAPLARPKAPPPVKFAARLLLAPLVFALPVLCLAAIFARLATRGSEPRIRYAWAGFLCTLLTASGFIWSAVFAAFLVLRPVSLHKPAPLGWDLKIPAAASLPSADLTPAELAKRVGGFVFIVARDGLLGGNRSSLPEANFGTGVLLYAGTDEYLVATSRHVIDGEAWKTADPKVGEVVLFDRERGSARASVVGRHKNLDLALLAVPRSERGSDFALPILDFSKVPEGERIMTFGHPEGLFFSLGDGLVSRKDAKEGLLQITAPVSPGASGGPVYDLRGRLIGIVTSMIDKKKNPNSENLNFAIRADSFLRADQWDASPEVIARLERFALKQSEVSEAGPSSAATPTPTPSGNSDPAAVPLSPSSDQKPKETPKRKQAHA
jgi:Trypsin-like peptidase domain